MSKLESKTVKMVSEILSDKVVSFGFIVSSMVSVSLVLIEFGITSDVSFFDCNV